MVVWPCPLNRERGRVYPPTPGEPVRRGGWLGGGVPVGGQTGLAQDVGEAVVVAVTRAFPWPDDIAERVITALARLRET
ncbi:hypothetical protein ABZ814_15045 [Micromonospora musae]|uniref:hypothetical protein n=1 Tax=Micromonospora musae TaxID=1894970 RepID=UPI0033E63FC5